MIVMNKYCVVYIEYNDVDFAPRKFIQIVKESNIERFKLECIKRHFIIEKIEHFETTAPLTTKE